MGQITEIAVIQDRDGEIPYPLTDCQSMEKEGGLTYLCYRVYGDFTEHVFRFD